MPASGMTARGWWQYDINDIVKGRGTGG